MILSLLRHNDKEKNQCILKVDSTSYISLAELLSVCYHCKYLNKGLKYLLNCNQCYTDEPIIDMIRKDTNECHHQQAATSTKYTQTLRATNSFMIEVTTLLATGSLTCHSVLDLSISLMSMPLATKSLACY